MKRLMLLLTFTVVGWTLTFNASAKTIVTDGLVSYWSLDRSTINDRTVEDVWGGNDATIAGDPKVVRGYISQGLELDGLGDYVSLPNASNFGSQMGPYTFEVWFKTSNKKSWSAIYHVKEPPCHRNTSGNGILLNAAWGGMDRETIVTKEDTIFFHRSKKSGDSGCVGGSGRWDIGVSDGKWHHIVFTSRPPNQEEKGRLRNIPHGRHIPAGAGDCLTKEFYLDTEPILGSVGCSSGDIRPYTLPIFLGAENNNGKALGFFQGVFDEVRIYDRALTEEEVIRNYESGIGLSVEPIEKLSTVWGALKTKP